jgi:hypothetical protein
MIARVSSLVGCAALGLGTTAGFAKEVERVEARSSSKVVARCKELSLLRSREGAGLTCCTSSLLVAEDEEMVGIGSARSGRSR